MEPLLLILAAAGVSALLLRLARAVFRLIQRSGEAWIAAGAASSRQRRGDITGLDEAANLERRARTGRRNATLRVAFWLVVLLAPPFTPWTIEVYAACSLLWLTRTGAGGRSLVRTEPPVDR